MFKLTEKIKCIKCNSDCIFTGNVVDTNPPLYGMKCEKCGYNFMYYIKQS